MDSDCAKVLKNSSAKLAFRLKGNLTSAAWSNSSEKIVKRPKLLSTSTTSFNRNINSNIDVYEKVVELDLARQRGDKVDCTVVKRILAAIRQFITRDSQYKQLMSWMIDCIEENIFLSKSEFTTLADEIPEIRTAKMMKEDLTYRKAAVLISKSLVGIKEQLNVAKQSLSSQQPQAKKSIPTILKGDKRSAFYHRQLSIQAPNEDFVSEDESPNGTVTDANISAQKLQLQPQIIDNSPMNEVNTPQKDNPPQKRQHSKVLLTAINGAESMPSSPLPEKASRPVLKKGTSIMLIGPNNLNENSPKPSYDRLDGANDDKKEDSLVDLPGDHLSAMILLNSKLTTEMDKAIQSNTALKLSIIDMKTDLENQKKDIIERLAKASAEEERHKKKVLELTEENMRVKEKFGIASNTILKIKNTISNMFTKTSEVLKLAEESLNRDRDLFSTAVIIKEPNLLQMAEAKGLPKDCFGISDKLNFISNVDQILSALVGLKKVGKKLLNFKNQELEKQRIADMNEPSPSSDYRMQLQKTQSPSGSNMKWRNASPEKIEVSSGEQFGGNDSPNRSPTLRKRSFNMPLSTQKTYISKGDGGNSPGVGGRSGQTQKTSRGNTLLLPAKTIVEEEGEQTKQSPQMKSNQLSANRVESPTSKSAIKYGIKNYTLREEKSSKEALSLSEESIKLEALPLSNLPALPNLNFVLVHIYEDVYKSLLSMQNDL